MKTEVKDNVNESDRFGEISDKEPRLEPSFDHYSQTSI